MDDKPISATRDGSGKIIKDYSLLDWADALDEDRTEAIDAAVEYRRHPSWNNWKHLLEELADLKDELRGKLKFEDLEEMDKIEITVDGNKTVAKMGGRKGVAKCAPEDKFDIFVGAKLALERLEEEYGWLKEGMSYYQPSITTDKMFLCATYYNDAIDKIMIRRGLVFKTEKEAIEATKKMLAVLKED